MKVVLLNGPPRAGKSQSAKIIYEKYLNTYVWGFSYHLKRFVHGIYLGDYGWNLPPDVFDDTKNEPQELLSGNSWRQMYIHHSEIAIKPVHGKQWFGKMFLQIIEQETTDYTQAIIVPDSGFYDEALPVVEKFGAENVYLLNVYRSGTSFAGDSRSYIDLTDLGVKQFNVINNDNLAALEITLYHILSYQDFLVHV